MDMSSKDFTISKYHDGLGAGDFSVSDVIGGYLNNIEKKDSDINAFLDVYKDEALEKARELEKQNMDGRKLYGVPVAVKDNILVADKKATSASKILDNYVSAYNATVVNKLEEQGAIIIGKTNLDEFAMGSSTEASAFKVTKNPHNLEQVPGGSSGGSASAVASEMTMVALGSDTGGSIRQPAGLCGVVGMKPTYGAVSRYGLMPLSSSLDQIGPLTMSVEDSARVFGVISGYDNYDATSAKKDFSDILDNVIEKPNKMTIGIPKEYFIDGIQDDVKIAVENVIKKFEKDGFSIKEVSLPNTKYALSVYYIIMPAEASSNLARFDGIRYSRLEEVKSKELSLLDTYLKQREMGFGEEVKRRILLGTFVLSAGYYDAYYAKAQKVRRLILNDFNDIFDSGIDALITPVTPTTAFKIGEKINDPLSMYLSDVFTIPVNLAGLPAISIPTGENDKDNLPINFQIIGKHFDEKKIFSLGNYFEKNIK